MFNVLSFVFVQRIIPLEKSTGLAFCILPFLMLLLAKIRIARVLMLVFVFLASFRFLNVFYVDFSPATWIYLVNSLVILSVYHKINTKSLLVVFCLYSSYVLYRLWLTGDPNSVFINSRNYVSFYTIIFVCAYYIKAAQSYRIALWPALLALFICVLAIGRSGIVSASILVFGVVADRIGVLKTTIFVIAMFTFLATMTFSKMEYFADLERFSSLNSALADRGRANISQEILAQPWMNYLFGFSETSIPTVHKLGHLHSSLWNLSTAIGIIPMVIVIFIFLFKSLKEFIKGNFVLSAIIICLILRVSTDIGLLFSPFDYVLFSSIALTYRKDLIYG